jgi:hypothetical protein
MAFGSGPAARKLPTSPKPKFPSGTRPINVYGPNINKHPSLPSGASSTAVKPPKALRAYGKPPGGDFEPYGDL